MLPAARYHCRGTYNRTFHALLLPFIILSILGKQILAQSVPNPSDSCSATQPCAVGCCDNFGVCGMGPEFCSPENCLSSCDAKAECDPGGWGPQYATSETCPLNVCCSQFGFCGTTPEFCGNKIVKNPSCPGGASASGRNIGYYEGWAITRPCDVMLPATIPWIDYTHINFAFASIDPVSFEIVPASPADPELYLQLTSLKSLIPGLQVWISIGGWSFTDPGEPTATTFSDLAGSAANQLLFSNSLISFMSTYGFDGVDIDWEYPVAPERNGSPGDFANYPIWLSQLRGAFNNAGTHFGLSITLPSSFWYLQNFDIVALEPLVDWFNIMEYDLHGTWDATDVWIGPYVAAHTNLTEIDESLKLLWNNNINPSKVTLGLGFYGRTYTLQDPTCTAPGCPFTGGAPAGPCTQSVGTLSYAELENIISTQGGIVTEDTTAAVNIVTWGNGYWASFDTAATFQLKVDYANNNCLGGTMVWAASLDDASGTAAKALAAARSGLDINSALLTNLLAIPNGNPVAGCVITGCSLTPGCPGGMTLVQQTSLGCYGPLFDGVPEGHPVNSFCCPSNSVPSCSYAAPVFQSLSPQCGTPACPIGTKQIFQGYDSAGTCPLNAKNYCCADTQAVNARDVGCFWTDCGTISPSCPSGTTELVTATLGQDGANTCLDGTVQSLCCPTPLQINPSTCFWEAPNIYGICLPELNCISDRQIAVAGDINRGGCTLGWSTFCCDPPSNPAVAVTAGLADFANVAKEFFAGGTCSSGLSSSTSSKRAFENAFKLAVRRRNSPSLLKKDLGEDNELALILRFLVYGEDPASDESNDPLNEWENPSLYRDSSRPKKKRQNLSTPIGTLQFAERLVPFLYLASDNPGPDSDIQMYADEYENARINADSNASPWSSLLSLVKNDITSPELIALVAGSLCHITTSNVDPIICSSATCSTDVCPANIPTLDKRIRGATPADVSPQGSVDTNSVTVGAAFSDPSTYLDPLGPGFEELSWWTIVKNMDWWLGSNHGVSSVTGQDISSSAFVDFATNPGSNLFTGAGPVWGCTTVAVVSNLGAWTAHFWESSFANNFQNQVINFLHNGNQPENYQGLDDLTNDGQIFSLALVKWIRVVIMTPQSFKQIGPTSLTPFVRPTINPIPGAKYPSQVFDIESEIFNIFHTDILAISDFSSTIRTYSPDQGIWDWFEQVTPSATGTSSTWHWRLDRSIRGFSDPWAGMMTVQRSGTNDPSVTPAVRIYVENNIVIEKNL